MNELRFDEREDDTMATTIGLPSLTITFQAAAQQAANRSKKGYVGVFVRDAKAQGVHQLVKVKIVE